MYYVELQSVQSLQSLQSYGLINYEKAWNLSEGIRIFTAP